MTVNFKSVVGGVLTRDYYLFTRGSEEEPNFECKKKTWKLYIYKMGQNGLLVGKTLRLKSLY